MVAFAAHGSYDPVVLAPRASSSALEETILSSVSKSVVPEFVPEPVIVPSTSAKSILLRNSLC